MTCQQMKTSSLATSGINITNCGAVCCESDLCNNPGGVRDYSSKNKMACKELHQSFFLYCHVWNSEFTCCYSNEQFLNEILRKLIK